MSRVGSRKGRYVLHPGKDGEGEYISADKLMRLYGLDREQRTRAVVHGVGDGFSHSRQMCTCTQALMGRTASLKGIVKICKQPGGFSR